MVYLAWEAFADVEDTTTVNELSSKGFTRGFIANVLNPKALVFYVAVVGQFANPVIGSLWWQILVLGALHLMVAIILVPPLRHGADPLSRVCSLLEAC